MHVILYFSSQAARESEMDHQRAHQQHELLHKENEEFEKESLLRALGFRV